MHALGTAMGALVQASQAVLHERVLAEIAAECATDPVRFVMAALA